MEGWYVVYTKSRCEGIAEENLRRQAFETYLPWIKISRVKRGNRMEVIEPMFPRYLFVRLDLKQQNIAPIRSTRGVIKLVMFGDRISQASDNIIQALKHTADVKSGLHCMHSPLFKKGDDVTVVSGPLKGLKGIFHASCAKDRVVILMEMLGRTNTVILQSDCIFPDDGWLAS